MNRLNVDRFRYFACLIAFAVWWGGLTLYAAVVVPIGTEVFGSTPQGVVTQQVTNYLNWLSVVCLALLFWHLLSHCTLPLISTWAIMLAATLALFVLHTSLDKMLDAGALAVIDTDVFYARHRVYLLVTTAQWLAGLVHLWFLCDAQPATPSLSTTVLCRSLESNPRKPRRVDLQED